MYHYQQTLNALYQKEKLNQAEKRQILSQLKHSEQKSKK